MPRTSRDPPIPSENRLSDAPCHFLRSYPGEFELNHFHDIENNMCDAIFVTEISHGHDCFRHGNVRSAQSKSN